MENSTRINAGYFEERPHPDLICSVSGLCTVNTGCFHEYGEYQQRRFMLAPIAVLVT